MTSQFNSIIEKIKTDKNVQVAVASIAAASVLVIGGTTYYLNQSQPTNETYKKVASIGRERYEKIRKDKESDLKIDDKLVDSINSVTSSTSSNRLSEQKNSSDSSNQTHSSSDSFRSEVSSSVTPTLTSESTSTSESVESSNQYEESSNLSKTEDSNDRSVSNADQSSKKDNNLKKKEFSSRYIHKRNRRSTDQSDWNDGQPEKRRSDLVSGDNWNDEDVVEEIDTDK